jgi:hypothetical protein
MGFHTREYTPIRIPPASLVSFAWPPTPYKLPGTFPPPFTYPDVPSAIR